MRREAGLAVCVGVLVHFPAHAFAASEVRGRMTSDGVTGRNVTGHGWIEENIFVGQYAAGFGAGCVTLHAPPGWYSISGAVQPPGFPAGTYAMFTQRFDGCPAFSYADKQFPSGSVVLDNVELRTPAHYSVMYNEHYNAWGADPWLWGTDFYQTFVATGRYVTRLATKLAGKSGDHYSMTLNFALYLPNDGPPSTWRRISAIRSQFLPGSMDPIIHVLWVPYRSNEFQLTPGQTYAMRFWRATGSQSDSFAIVVRRDTGNGYAGGHLYNGDAPRQDLDAYAYCSGGMPDTLVNHTPLLDLTFYQLATWSERFGQTFRASGTGLAGCDIAYTTGDPNPPSIPITFQLYDGVGGERIGRSKKCYGLSRNFHGRAAAIWAPNEAPLTPGRTYYLEWTSPGCNTWFMKEDLVGAAYANGVVQGSRDLLMSIAEYAMPQPTIELSTSEIALSVFQGRNPPPQTFTVKNTNSSTLNYLVADDAPWCSVDPAFGSSTGEEDVITVSFSAAALPLGLHTATISVTSTNAANSPQYVTVTLDVQALGDFDRDADVDLADFSTFQLCFNGPNRPKGANCTVDADFDDDGDIDLDDFMQFQRCFNGFDRPPACP